VLVNVASSLMAAQTATVTVSISVGVATSSVQTQRAAPYAGGRGLRPGGASKARRHPVRLDAQNPDVERSRQDPRRCIRRDARQHSGDESARQRSSCEMSTPVNGLRFHTGALSRRRWTEWAFGRPKVACRLRGVARGYATRVTTPRPTQGLPGVGRP